VQLNGALRAIELLSQDFGGIGFAALCKIKHVQRGCACLSCRMMTSWKSLVQLVM
jgi:hypothetical protein